MISLLIALTIWPFGPPANNSRAWYARRLHRIQHARTHRAHHHGAAHPSLININ